MKKIFNKFRVTSIISEAGQLISQTSIRHTIFLSSLTTFIKHTSESSWKNTDRIRFFSCIPSKFLPHDPKVFLHDFTKRMGRKKTDFLRRCFSHVKNLSSPPSFFPFLQVKKIIYNIYI